jgi:hypothetical protein
MLERLLGRRARESRIDGVAAGVAAGVAEGVGVGVTDGESAGELEPVPDPVPVRFADPADPFDDPDEVRDSASSSREGARACLRGAGDCATGVRTDTAEDPEVRRLAEGVWKPRDGLVGLRGVAGMKGRSASSCHPVRSGEAARVWLWFGCSRLVTRLCDGEGRTDCVTSGAARVALASWRNVLDADAEREPGRPGRLYDSGIEVAPSGRR